MEDICKEVEMEALFNDIPTMSHLHVQLGFWRRGTPAVHDLHGQGGAGVGEAHPEQQWLQVQRVNSEDW